VRLERNQLTSVVGLAEAVQPYLWRQQLRSLTKVSPAPH
jgi:hypothetical protein